MDTRIGRDNPFGHTRQGFAWQHVPASSVCHLDFGCYQGHLLGALRRKGVQQLVGIDVAGEAVETARQIYTGIEFYHLRQSIPLPFTDGLFTSITLLDVLEHVDDQKALLDELHRVLRDEGLLVVTVPQQHVFSFLDRGNYKFRFPHLHRWYYRLRHSRAEYERRYVSNPDGLVGDVSANKRWHEHFTPQHLGEILVASGFQPVLFDGSGLFTRVTSHLHLLLDWVPFARRLLHALERADARRFKSMNLFCLARKGLPTSHREGSS